MEEPILSLSKLDIRKLLGAASGDAALLYLYGKMGYDMAQVGSALQMSTSRMDCAMASLRQLGLAEEKPKFLQPGEHPAYTETDVSREMAKGKEFGLLVGETQRRLGRILSGEELKILLSIYDYLGLPMDVINVLITYCMQRAAAKGNPRTPSIRSIEKEAYFWADNGIDTFEEATAYLRKEEVTCARIQAVQQALQLGDRRLSAGEERYVRSWLSLGFGVPEIQLAYERTCLATGCLKWGYMNSILQSWKNQGLYTLPQIEAGDQHGKPRQNAVQRQKQDFHNGNTVDPLELKAIARMMNRGNKQEE